MPNFEDSQLKDFGDPLTLVDLAQKAEDAGWDGFFLWDHLQINRQWKPNVVDPWVVMGAIAVETSKMHIGPLVTPMSRRRPWKVAREIVSLDHLCKGRLIFGVGLGEPKDEDFKPFGEVLDNKIRAQLLDEGLEILTGLFTGEDFSYAGKHYTLDNVVFRPKPYNDKVPIWVGGGWPNKRPFRRAARYDGVMPVHPEWPNYLEASDYSDMVAYIREHRNGLDGFDVVAHGELKGSEDENLDTIAAHKDAGATWWVENIHGMRAEWPKLVEIVEAGPLKS